MQHFPTFLPDVPVAGETHRARAGGVPRAPSAGPPGTPALRVGVAPALRMHPPCPSGLEGWLCCSTSEDRKGVKNPIFNFGSPAPGKMPSWIGAKALTPMSAAQCCSRGPKPSRKPAWAHGRGDKDEEGKATRCFDSLFKNSPALAKGQCLFQKGRWVPFSSWKPHKSPRLLDIQFKKGLKIATAVMLSTGKFCLTFY